MHKSLTVSDIRKMRENGEPIAALTAYEAGFASEMDAAGADVVLVGDSLGMVVQGQPDTIAVTTDEMVYHCALVRRGLERAYLMADLPFLSYASHDQALFNAARLLQQGGASMVKLEVDGRDCDLIGTLSRRSIPVCAHIGLRPQQSRQLGGYGLHGRDEKIALRTLEDARMLEQAGADMILVECVPSELGQRIREAVSVPVIGIGAGPGVDGQILVMYDMLGMGEGPHPRFVVDFLKECGSIRGAFSAYVQAVKNRLYPSPEQSYGSV